MRQVSYIKQNMVERGKGRDVILNRTWFHGRGKGSKCQMLYQMKHAEMQASISVLTTPIREPAVLDKKSVQ
jgi:hypothetical protein